MGLHIRARPEVVTALCSFVFSAACGGARGGSAPAIEFTKVPPFGVGDPRLLNPIEGRATGAGNGEQVVLYARSGVWWIQPLSTAPLTPVDRDSTWKNQTHPGSAYAALLVKAGYRPSLRTDVLPEKGGAILAVAKVEGAVAPKAAGRTLQFAGYEWLVREMPNDPGGTLNFYDAANAYSDALGLLHLKIAKREGRWTSAEINLQRSLGYGTYRFVVRDLSQLEPAAVFSMFTWDDDGPAREMDIEISQWGEPGSRNGQFVIQPYHVPANTVQFQVPPGPVTLLLRWTAGGASFRAFRGAAAGWDSPSFKQHSFTSGVPSAGHEKVHMNFYVFASDSHPLRNPSEVIVEKFEYLP